MPRPLNWVRGEGTYKNQRRGLGLVTADTPVTGLDLNSYLLSQITNPGIAPSNPSMTLDWNTMMGQTSQSINPFSSYNDPTATTPSSSQLLMYGVLAIGAALLVSRI